MGTAPLFLVALRPTLEKLEVVKIIPCPKSPNIAPRILSISAHSTAVSLHRLHCNATDLGQFPIAIEYYISGDYATD